MLDSQLENLFESIYRILASNRVSFIVAYMVICSKQDAKEISRVYREAKVIPTIPCAAPTVRLEPHYSPTAFGLSAPGMISTGGGWSKSESAMLYGVPFSDQDEYRSRMSVVENDASRRGAK